MMKQARNRRLRTWYRERDPENIPKGAPDPWNVRECSVFRELDMMFFLLITNAPPNEMNSLLYQVSYNFMTWSLASNNQPFRRRNWCMYYYENEFNFSTVSIMTSDNISRPSSSWKFSYPQNSTWKFWAEEHIGFLNRLGRFGMLWSLNFDDCGW